MKTTKKRLALLLALVMMVTTAEGFLARAETAITVTLRVELDEATRIPPVKVTLTDADKKDYGIGLSSKTLTPLHALAKYMSEKKGATDETMKQYIRASKSAYGLYLEGISTDGTSSGSAAAGSQTGVYWMFALNNTSPSVGMDACELTDHQLVVLYGLWGGGDYPDTEETNYSYFNENTYTAVTGTPLTVTLKGLGYDSEYNSVEKAMTDATILAAPYDKESDTATEANAVIKEKTDASGNAALTFSKPGSYVLSACRKAPDGVHFNLSRPYAVVTVTDAGTAPTGTPTPTASPVPTGTPAPTASPSPTGKLSNRISAPVQPKGVKATVKKGGRKKKTVKLTWKKIKNARGYRVLIAKKGNKGKKPSAGIRYKKLADTKKPKLTFKRPKGTYYIRVKAYTIGTDQRRLYGKNSKTLKIRL